MATAARVRPHSPAMSPLRGWGKKEMHRSITMPPLRGCPWLGDIRPNRRLDDFWKQRLNAHAARGDCLALAV